MSAYADRSARRAAAQSAYVARVQDVALTQTCVDRPPLALAPPVPTAPVRRGSYADHRSQFPELYVIPTGDLTITEIMARCPHPTRRS